MIQPLKFSTAASSKQTSTWDRVNQNPSGKWDAIEPFFRIRDDIVKWLRDIGPDLSFMIPIAKISGGVDKMVYAGIAEVIGPVLRNVHQQLEVKKERLLTKEKATVKDAESDIFASNSTATNPSHSQIVKDHFECLLNTPAVK